MTWTQPTDPLNSIMLSALIAAFPIMFICWALVVRKMKGYLASIFTVIIALAIAIIAYGMPVKLALLSTAHGAMYGLFPICWIIISAVFLYNLSVKSGQFEIIKNFMAGITPDRRIQAILIAFCFGAFLEGTAGMGTPVAITAAMLAGLGFNPLYAAGLCLIANTAPVAFGGIGIPVTVASQVSGLPEMAISQMIGRTLPLLSLLIPFYLVLIMSGLKKTIEVLPAILVTGLSFSILQWFSSNFMSPMLPDVISSIGSIIALLLFLKFWKPKSVWRFKEETQDSELSVVNNTTGQILRAWSPWLILTSIIIAWGLKPVKETLDTIGMWRFGIPGLHNVILAGENSQSAISQIFRFNFLSATGTAIFITTVISIFIFNISFKTALNVLYSTLKQMKYPVLTISSVLGFAYLANNSGMSITMAKALTNTGMFFPFFSPVLGWLGVFLTGSDTSSNALFGKLQSTTASALNIDPVLTVSANASGGVTGKMISPQSIAVGAAAVGLVGKESDLFRFTFRHSFIFLLLICLITVIQAYVFKWMIPAYKIISNELISSKPDLTRGIIYLLILAAVISTLVTLVGILNRKVKASVKNT
jgi:lactate permease